jgi:hypothetical protein
MSAYKPSLVRVRGLIAQDRTLAMLVPEAERLRTLNQRFGKAVAPAVARVCRIVALQGTTALVHCGNGAAAARLRSQATTVARALATAEQPVETLKIKLRADWNLPARPEKAGMGTQAVTAWAELESQLPEGGLKEAVDRLLHHHRSG